MKFIKENFITLIILVLVGIIYLERCNAPEIDTKPTIVRDTIFVEKDSIIYSKPQLIKIIERHDTAINNYIPDTNYKKLVLQYQQVVNELLAKNVMQDSIKIDSIGYVKITDTLQKNLIIGRSSKVNVKYPIIKETVTLPYEPKNQLYIGGSVQVGPIGQINGGVLFKNKKDQIFGGSVGINSQGQILYGAHSYWKIKLK